MTSFVEFSPAALCADQRTFACEGAFRGVILEVFANYLSTLGYSTVRLPNRGTVIAKRDGVILLATHTGRFVLSRLSVPEQAAALIGEIVAEHDKGQNP